MQRLKDRETKIELNYFLITDSIDSSYISKKYKERALFYIESNSYRGVLRILNDISGSNQISRQCLNDLVETEALKVSNSYIESYSKMEEKELPKINYKFDIYDKEIKETIIEIDGILTKKQKEIRDKVKKVKKEFVTNNICLLELKNGKYEYIIEPINENGDSSVDLSNCIKNSLKKEYSGSEEILNIISISDGAKDIRNTFKDAFYSEIQIILDWYHICKKSREYLSMISVDKKNKKIHLKYMLNLFWYGEVDKAIEYLNKIDSKNNTKRADFLNYLEKHKLEIINYDKRKKIGKTIGSGRVEKAVDQIIGARQKKKGMSWSKIGSKSLGILKVCSLNRIISNKIS